MNMAVGKRHDKTGRSTSVPVYKRTRRSIDPPRDEPWLALPLSLMSSPVLRVMSGAAFRMLFRLMQEHLGHGRVRNGELAVSYKGFEEAGVKKDVIRQSLLQLEHLGLLKRTDCGRRPFGADRGRTATYRLTMFGADSSEATNDYKKHQTIESAQAALLMARKQLESERSTRVRSQTARAAMKASSR